MSWVIGGVTLPLPPTRTNMKKTADSSSIRFPADYPYKFSYGIKEKKLQLEGYIAQQGQDKTYLETTYILPLDALVRTKVHIETTITRFHGDWLFEDFEYEETGGYEVSFKFKMTFSKGVDYIVV